MVWSLAFVSRATSFDIGRNVYEGHKEDPCLSSRPRSSDKLSEVQISAIYLGLVLDTLTFQVSLTEKRVSDCLQKVRKFVSIHTAMDEPSRQSSLPRAICQARKATHETCTISSKVLVGQEDSTRHSPSSSIPRNEENLSWRLSRETVSRENSFPPEPRPRL